MKLHEFLRLLPLKHVSWQNWSINLDFQSGMAQTHRFFQTKYRKK